MYGVTDRTLPGASVMLMCGWQGFWMIAFIYIVDRYVSIFTWFG
jgi:hypothetical protein